MHAATHSTYQLSEIVLKLRDDLNVNLRAEGGEPTWLVEDERTGRFYRVGRREYVFVSLLDGRRTFGAALGRAAALLKEKAIPVEEAAGLCRWLVECGLATTEHSQTAKRALRQAAAAKQGRWLQGLLNPLSYTIPLFRPDRLFALLAAAMGWLFSLPMVLLGMGILVAGGFAVAEEWDRFRAMTPSIVTQLGWLWLVATWAVLKVIHETAHGVVCRKYGGVVREAGVALILFIPLPYVDVTSSWRFGSKWQRIATSAAGMWAELVVGALAAIVWSRTEPGLIHQQAHAVVISATLVTLLFNANPLMRFDGYYILVDLLGMPNLSTHGAQAIRQLGRRWFLGLPGRVAGQPGGRSWLVLTYGVAAWLWRIAICVGLILAADALFFGAGVVLAVFAAIMWGVVPLMRLAWFVLRGSSLERPSRLRFVAAVTMLAAGVWGIGREVRWSPSIEAPAVVAYYPTVEIRPAVPGFVESISIDDGEVVSAGEELLRLANPELTADLAEIGSQIEQAELQCQAELTAGAIAAWEAGQERLIGLRKRFAQLEERRTGLVIRAPCTGRVLDADVASLLGRYVQVGEPVLMLGGADDKQVIAVVDPAERGEFESYVGESLEVCIDGRPGAEVIAEVATLSSRADHKLPHPALGAHNGGRLDVRPSVDPESDREQLNRYELTQPRLLARLVMEEDAAKVLWAGETGVVRLPAAAKPLLVLLEEKLSNWWTRREAALLEQWYR